MNALRYLGDEASAAGFRLAGCEAFAASPGRERAAFEEACAGAALVPLADHAAVPLEPSWRVAALEAVVLAAGPDGHLVAAGRLPIAR